MGNFEVFLINHTACTVAAHQPRPGELPKFLSTEPRCTTTCLTLYYCITKFSLFVRFLGWRAVRRALGEEWRLQGRPTVLHMSRKIWWLRTSPSRWGRRLSGRGSWALGRWNVNSWVLIFSQYFTTLFFVRLLFWCEFSKHILLHSQY